MGAINWLMRRRGFVQLDRYGLRLTGDDRIESTRDGKVVGWRDDDFAMAAPIVPVIPPPKHAQVLPIAQPIPTPPPMPAVKAPVAAKPQAVIVADEPVVEEDDWEWEIAMARARAAAEEIEQAVVELVPKKVAAKPLTENTVPYAENPFYESWEDAGSRTPRSFVKTVSRHFAPEPTREVPQRAHRGPTPSTIIPVPKLPKMGEHQSRLAPVVRAPQLPSQPPRRTARGTGQQVSEDTVRTQAAPANEDMTKPGIAMPSAVPSLTKRVAAPQK